MSENNSAEDSVIFEQCALSFQVNFVVDDSDEDLSSNISLFVGDESELEIQSLLESEELRYVLAVY